ncbi:MAG: helix-turn-helix transcriptional regulator [Acetobacteraceae bacterium]
MSAIGDAIYEARIKREWTQADLANRVGVSGATISNLENGRADPHRYRNELQNGACPALC